MSKMEKSTRNFIHPFLIASCSSKIRATHLHQKCLPDNDSPSTTRSSAKSVSWTALSHPLFTYCALKIVWHALLSHRQHYLEFTIIFPPLLLTIILDFPAFTFSPLSRRLTLHPSTRLPSCSIVGAISTKSSAYRNSEGRPLLAWLGAKPTFI